MDQLKNFEKEYWIIIAEVSKLNPSFYVRKWSDVSQDISNQYPNVMNIWKMSK